MTAGASTHAMGSSRTMQLTSHAIAWARNRRRGRVLAAAAGALLLAACGSSGGSSTSGGSSSSNQPFRVLSIL